MSREEALIIVNIFGYLTLGAQAALIVLVLIFLFFRSNKTFSGIFKFLSENSLSLSFLVALTATFGSLFFSEVAHFLPCKLCWYQRIAMYPQVILLGIAAVKNDFSIRKYILPLSLIGLGVSIYHYLLQMSPIPLPCSDEVANCALKQFAYFGYITIPLMAATAFSLIIFLMLASSKNNKR